MNISPSSTTASVRFEFVLALIPQVIKLLFSNYIKNRKNVWCCKYIDQLDMCYNILQGTGTVKTNTFHCFMPLTVVNVNLCRTTTIKRETTYNLLINFMTFPFFTGTKTDPLTWCIYLVHNEVMSDKYYFYDFAIKWIPSHYLWIWPLKTVHQTPKGGIYEFNNFLSTLSKFYDVTCTSLSICCWCQSLFPFVCLGFGFFMFTTVIVVLHNF